MCMCMYIGVGQASSFPSHLPVQPFLPISISSLPSAPHSSLSPLPFRHSFRAWPPKTCTRIASHLPSLSSAPAPALQRLRSLVHLPFHLAFSRFRFPILVPPSVRPSVPTSARLVLSPFIPCLPSLPPAPVPSSFPSLPSHYSLHLGVPFVALSFSSTHMQATR
jgi:hypothetical protein